MKKIKLSKLSKFRTKRNMNFLTVFLCLDLLIVFSLIKTSSASYVAQAVGNVDVKVALYAFNVNVKDGNDVANIDLGALSPGETKTIKIEVKNTDSNGTPSDTNIRYNLKIITTTNIGFEYELYKNEVRDSNKLVAGRDYQISTHGDGYGTQFKHFALEDKCMKYESASIHNYYLTVKFPSSYNSYIYQDLIESIKVQLLSEQVTSGDCEVR